MRRIYTTGLTQLNREDAKNAKNFFEFLCALRARRPCRAFAVNLPRLRKSSTNYF